MTKGDYARVVPVHSHLIDQGFLDFVEKRRSLKLPLFYDPKRARGGTNANPQYQKVGERLGERVREVLKVTGVERHRGSARGRRHGRDISENAESKYVNFTGWAARIFYGLLTSRPMAAAATRRTATDYPSIQAIVAN